MNLGLRLLRIGWMAARRLSPVVLSRATGEATFVHLAIPACRPHPGAHTQLP